MTILHLTLTHQWYDKIASGEKCYEYRAVTPYWEKRLAKHYDVVRFHRGYTNTTMDIELVSIDITSEPNDLGLDRCYRIALGRRIG